MRIPLSVKLAAMCLALGLACATAVILTEDDPDLWGWRWLLGLTAAFGGTSWLTCMLCLSVDKDNKSLGS